MVANAKAPKIKKSSEFLRIMKQLSYNKLAMFGLILFILELVVCFSAPLIAPYGYNDLNIMDMNQAPNAAHWFGTDELGRDIFSRILYGGRYSISMGVSAIVVAMIVGMFIGSIAGYFGGWVDNILMRFLDIVQSLPGMLLTIVISAVLGPGFINTILALSVNAIPHQARMLRAQILKIRNSEYIEAAQSINCSKATIILDHLIPNSMSPMIVQASMGVANQIIMASSLSFIGLGVQPPAPEWGAMLSGSRQYIRNYPHMVIFPGLAIAVTVLSLNLLGDGLRDALDPRLRR
ncbi:MAG: ABC transporter permease [Firmicutes bacterium]|nr:ABC transporter permease [Bacillota bacterium]